MRYHPLISLGSLGLVLAAARAENAPTADQVTFFEKNIRPVLVSKCYDCHSAKAEKVKGNLLLDTRDGVRQGGDSGHAVVPGNLDESLLIAAIRYTDKDTQMPPAKSGGKLPDEVIANFEQWVRMGAPDPRDGAAKTAEQMSTEKAKEFWSFKQPVKTPVPAVKNQAWPISEIDRRVLASLEAKNLSPVEDADPRALLRRVYFDLIGMPPPMGAMDSFAKEWSKGREAGQKSLAFVVDKLMQTPQYGERWGRHWLDVARYGESTGKEINDLFPTAWRYRDYVIDSFNEDKPYDLFVREQIAGDLMPVTNAEEYNDRLTATAFLALGTKNLGEKKKLQFAMDQVDEQIDAVSKSVLGITVACARCHDHKFDPISTRDYYAMAGIFRSTETFYGTNGKGGKYNVSRLLPLADESKSLSEQPELKQATEKLLAAALETERQNKKAKKMGTGKKGYARANRQSPQQIRREVMGVSEGPVMQSPIYIKGEIDDPGPVVPRGFVTTLLQKDTPAVPANASGRLELAQWLTSTNNPLTARVMVNRVWQHLFGQGLVRTADNFGSTGERPTHPELLDQLAIDFMSNGWSVKKLIREIVLSRTYQLSTRGDAANQQADPGNRLLWRMNPRRLDAEAIRDAMLTASGMMDLNPPGGSMVGSIGDGIASGYADRFVSAQFHYRSIYLPIVRDFVPSCLEVFDFAEPSLVIANRDTTNVPSQALYLMNNEFVIEQAKALAHRISTAPNLDHAGRIKLAYELALSRPPTDAERARADKFLRAEVTGLMKQQKDKVPAAAEEAYATFCQALFACAEFRYIADALPEAAAKLP
jgi:hypothetical protein